MLFTTKQIINVSAGSGFKRKTPGEGFWPSRWGKMNGAASNCDDREDLEVRSKQLECRRRDRASKTLIVLDDDDSSNDDVEILSASSSSFSQGRRSMSNRRGRSTVINLEDLELQVEPAGSRMPFGRARPLKHQNRSCEQNTLSCRDLVDLTTPSEEGQYISSNVTKKRKPAPSAEVKEIKLSCAICMENMKEETTTICGHVFCKKCIVRAIEVNKRCPTCRKKLTMKNIHRIYISGGA